MLRSLEDLIDAAVIATDGEIGKVRNFLLDDQSWGIRYLVVDVGSWLARRDVVIAVSAIEHPDWETKRFQTGLSREQVRNSPDLDTKRPVSRQQEIAMRNHFGWSEAWPDAMFPLSSLAGGQEFVTHSDDDQHLRSAEDMVGYAVWAKNNEIGYLETFIVDETRWHVGYLDVKMGDWLHRRSMLVSTRLVSSISWADHRVYLD